MKKRLNIFSISILMLAALLSGCAKDTENTENGENNDDTEKVENTENNKSEERNEDFVSEEDSQELFVVSGWHLSCSVDDGYIVYIPELKEGCGAILRADVDINSSSYDLKDIETMQRTTIEDIAASVNAPEIKRGEDYSDKYLMQYSEGDDQYYIIHSFHQYDFIKNGQEYMYYSTNAYTQDALEPFWTALSIGYQGAGTMLTPALTEDEILNMTDEEFVLLANLQMKGKLADQSYIVYDPATIIFEEGYKYSAFAASRPAEDDEEALKIAQQEWPVHNTDEYTNEEYILAETDEYWYIQKFFSKMEWGYFENMVVYKKDYYDTKEDWPEFVLTDEYVRNLVAFQETDYHYDSCLGEYLIDGPDGITFRRYCISGSDLDMDNSLYEGSLYVKEWHVSQDGAIEFIQRPYVLREIEGADISFDMYIK